MRTRLTLSLFALACSAGLHAQTVAGFGAVTGFVRDGYGDGLPDTKVVVDNANLGVHRNIVTTDEGVFDVPALVPGPGYSMKVTRKGFANWEARNFEVFVGQTVSFKIKMQVETAAARVGGPEAAIQVEDNTTNVSHLVGGPQVDTLPSRDRRVDSLVLLAPAVNTDRSSQTVAFRGELFPNLFLIDGNDATNHYYPSQKLGLALQITPDAVGEMQVIAAGASAEFGHVMGGTVNAVTKSGTSALHGAAYGYVDKQAWNAADRYSNGFDANDHGHRIGGDVGGGVAGQLFYFANLESVKGDSNGLNRILNPLLTNSTGSAIVNCTATTSQCASLNNFFSSQLNAKVTRSLSGLTGLARIDFRPDEFNSFNLEVNAMHRTAPNGEEMAMVVPNGTLLGYNGSYTEETRYAKLGWVSITGDNAVNDIRLGWYHDRFSNLPNSSLQPSTTGGTVITVAGSTVGANPEYPSILSEQRYQLVDTFSLTRGTHSLKFGVDASRNEDWHYSLPNRYGSYTYPSLSAFAQDFSANSTSLKNYTSFTQTFGKTVSDIHPTAINAYVEDTWKAAPRFTVNGGLRWEKLLVTKPSVSDSTYYLSARIPSPNVNFAPRLGAAYMIDDQTVVRASAGVFYQPFTGQLLDTLYSYNGYQTTISVNPNQTSALVFPKKYTALSSIPTGSKNVVYAASKFRNPYSTQASLALERHLAGGGTLTFSYLDSRGVKLITGNDLNLSQTTKTKDYTIDDASGTAVGIYTTYIWTAKGSSSYAHVWELQNGGSAKYHALALQLRKPVSKDLSVQMSYTWSHAIDDVSGATILGFIPSNTLPGNFREDQGNSSLDQRHRVVMNWTWQPTVIKGGSPVFRNLLNGWQVSSITTVATTLPETALVLVNGQQFTTTSSSTTTTMLYTNSLNGSGGWSRVPFYRANGLMVGPQYDVDARLGRTLQINERLKAMLTFEAYNAANTQYNTSVNTLAYTATSGVLKPVTGVGKGNASYGVPYGTNARHAQVSFRLVF